LTADALRRREKLSFFRAPQRFGAAVCEVRWARRGLPWVRGYNFTAEALRRREKTFVLPCATALPRCYLRSPLGRGLFGRPAYRGFAGKKSLSISVSQFSVKPGAPG